MRPMTPLPPKLAGGDSHNCHHSGKEPVLTKQMGKHVKKRYIAMYLYMLVILFALLTTASYTWFSLSRTPRVSDLYMYVNAPTGLELSLTPDAEEWELQLDFLDMMDVTAPLRPVTWSDAEQRFYAAAYGIDGRLTGQWEPLTDQRNANKSNLDGYYIKTSFYARSGQSVDVSLSPAVEVEEGIEGAGTYVIGYPEWNAEEIVHSNGGRGAQHAMRMGFRVTPVDKTGRETGSPSQFIIYEPNILGHPDNSLGYVPTPSIDGTQTLVPEDRLILQTDTLWTEADPVQRGVVVYHMGEFRQEPRLFRLNSGETVRIDLYVWLEGQDVDCTNEIHKAQILANVQFNASGEGQSGLVPIR